MQLTSMCFEENMPTSSLMSEVLLIFHHSQWQTAAFSCSHTILCP